MRTVFEPFRIKSIEPIKMTSVDERRALIEEAGYNPFCLRASDVQIDLLTDSGTGAMSSHQWAAIMEGDESYAGANGFFAFQKIVRDIFGHRHVLPTHQGRAAEKLLSSVVLKRDSVVIGNTHFDTTRANIEFAGAKAVDLPCDESRELSSRFPFKGNIDTSQLRSHLEQYGSDRVPFVLMTVTNNSAGGQPVSMSNLYETKDICDKFGVPLLIDAARFAENAWFIKSAEDGYADLSPKEIARKMFRASDGAVMSMKKDAFGNIGGLISINDDHLAEKLKSLLILTEGFPTYGGLAGRDLSALAVGLDEILDPEYLKYRIRSTSYVGERLLKAGVPVLQPFGGHAIYLDARKFCDHLPNEQLPGWALSVALYIHSGVRACEIGNVMFGQQEENGAWKWPSMDLLRLAIPRRVYTQSHMDYVIEGIIDLYRHKGMIRGLCFCKRPEQLPHFSATFSEVSA